MAWVTTGYIDALISAEVRTELFNDATTTVGAVTTVIGAAQAVVEAALREVGYTPPSTATDDLKLATAGQFIRLAYGRPTKNLPVPDSLAPLVDMVERGPDGRYRPTFEPEGLEPDQLAAVGGVKLTESDPDATDAKTQRATRDELAGF